MVSKQVLLSVTYHDEVNKCSDTRVKEVPLKTPKEFLRDVYEFIGSQWAGVIKNPGVRRFHIAAGFISHEVIVTTSDDGTISHQLQG